MFVQLKLVLRPGIQWRFIVLDQGFQLVQRLIQSGFRRLQRVHLPIKGVHPPGNLSRQASDPATQQGVLCLPVLVGFQEGRDISSEAFPKIMDETHANDFIHIQLRELTAQQKGHQGYAPTVLSYALRSAFRGSAVTQRVLQFFCNMQYFQILSRIHFLCPHNSNLLAYVRA